ncbi:MAG TPA: hypothetical protein VHQ01_05555 [Pyrinomonadaceae bacterium]|jgi:hypothetical protein|nr:hypothetical protein [Pyrinomonadaceae bacterium]
MIGVSTRERTAVIKSAYKMYLKNLAKVLMLVSICSFAFQGCNTAQVDTTSVPAPDASKNDAPYPNKEPEKYQTEIWQTTPAGIEKFFVARDGAKWRIDSSYGQPDQVTTIHTDKEYVFSFAAKIYAEYPISHGYDDREDTINAMTHGMLNAKEKGVFEKIGNEGGLTKYKVAPDAGKNVETLIYVDEKLGLPLKKEVFKTDGGQRVLDYSVQLTGFKPAADANMFELLKGYKLVSSDEMKKALTAPK